MFLLLCPIIILWFIFNILGDIMSHVVSGLIMIWQGAIGAIPAGWQICDGTNGTPDLRDRFVVGAGTTYNPGDSGGSTQHQHDFTGDGHTHDIEAGASMQSGAQIDQTTTNIQVTGTTDNASSLPPYYALAYIMFL